MNTNANGEREVFVIMDEVERGPFKLNDLHRDAARGTPSPDCLWRFSEESQYRTVGELLSSGAKAFVPPPMPTSHRTSVAFPIAIIGVTGLFTCVVAVVVLSLIAVICVLIAIFSGKSFF